MSCHFALDEHPRRKFIPPVEELNRSYGIQDGSPARLTTVATDLELGITRPRWTAIGTFLSSHLHLTPEFAYLFEFKFLQGCPVLNTLWLDIHSMITGEHTRVISEAGLSVPSSNSISLSFSQPMAGHLSLPCLSRLSGEWTIYDNVMQQLLAKTLPKVEQFYLQLWTMNTLESLLRVLRAKAQIYVDNGNEPLAFFITNPL